MHRHHRHDTGADGILFNMKGKFTMWKPNTSHLSYNLVVILLLLSRMKADQDKKQLK